MRGDLLQSCGAGESQAGWGGPQQCCRGVGILFRAPAQQSIPRAAQKLGRSFLRLL